MQNPREDPGHQRVATVDIETTHYKPHLGEVVSVGIGVHDRDSPLSDAEYELLHRGDQGAEDESVLISGALLHLNQLDYDYLVTYKGSTFDFDFLRERAKRVGLDVPALEADRPDTHIDLFEDGRKDAWDNAGKSWPSLEDALGAYGYEAEPQLWRGEELTNVRFGKELGPAYLDAVANGDEQEVDDLRGVIEEYLRDDLAKNLRLFYFDIGHDVAE